MLPQDQSSPRGAPRPIRTKRLAADPLREDYDLVLPTFTGTTVGGANVLGRHFRPHSKMTELPQIRSQDLRHTCATILLMAGKHSKYVQDLLGDPSISITLETRSRFIVGIHGGPADAMDDAKCTRVSNTSAAIGISGSTPGARILHR